MTTAIKWVTEVPSSSKGRPKDTWFDQFVKELKKKPGAWAQILEGPKSEIHSKAINIRNNHGEDFDVVTRMNPTDKDRAFLFASAKKK